MPMIPLVNAHSTEVRAFAALAMARYPKDPPSLAVAFLSSDRAAAWPGPLGLRTQSRLQDSAAVRRLGPVRTKTHDRFTGVVTFTMQRLEMALAVIQDPPEFESLSDPMRETMTMTVRPPIDIWLAVDVHRRDFATQRGRTVVAATLRTLRAAYRARLAEAGL